MNYQSIGSGGGIKQITAKTVNFGASDMPMKVEDLEKNGLMQFPAIMGGVVPVYNLKGIKAGEIRFTGELLANIYLGKVKKWNDAAIAGLNPGVKLPDDQHHRRAPFRRVGHDVPVDQLPLQGERRLEGAPWARAPRSSGPRAWAARATRGRLLCAEDQRCAGLRRVRLRQAEQAHGGHDAQQGGQVRPPRRQLVQAAAAGAEWTKTPGMGVVLTEQPGDGSWPVTGASFILIHKAQDKPAAGREVLRFFEWSFANGQKMADELDYVPMPEPVVKADPGRVEEHQDAAGKPVY